MPALDTGLHAVDTLLTLIAGILALCAYFLRSINFRQEAMNTKLDQLAERMIRIEGWREAHSQWCDGRHKLHEESIGRIELRLDKIFALHPDS